MAQSRQYEDDAGPDPPAGVEEPEADERDEDRPPEEPVTPSEDRVERVSAVELARRNQVDGGDEEAPPGRHEGGMLDDVRARERVAREDELEHLDGERVAEEDRPLAERLED